jgi:hypothetical protein
MIDYSKWNKLQINSSSSSSSSFSDDDDEEEEEDSFCVDDEDDDDESDFGFDEFTKVIRKVDDVISDKKDASSFKSFVYDQLHRKGGAEIAEFYRSSCWSWTSSSPLWNGLVNHHRDIFVSHVLPKLNETDVYFFGEVNSDSWELLTYANMTDVTSAICELSSISTLKWCWEEFPFETWGTCDRSGTHFKDQAWFCSQVASTNKFELLKWVREEKKCEWDERTTDHAACLGNLEILKYCLANNCPCNEKEVCKIAAIQGHLDCLRFLLDKLKPSEEIQELAVSEAAGCGHLHLVKYFIEERKILNHDTLSLFVILHAIKGGQMDCVKYLFEEVKIPLRWSNFAYNHIAFAVAYRQRECLKYLRERGCPEPAREQLAIAIDNSRIEN